MAAAMELQGVFEEFCKRERMCHAFVVGVGDHWVTVVARKLPGKDCFTGDVRSADHCQHRDHCECVRSTLRTSNVHIDIGTEHDNDNDVGDSKYNNKSNGNRCSNNGTANEYGLYGDDDDVHADMFVSINDNMQSNINSCHNSDDQPVDYHLELYMLDSYNTNIVSSTRPLLSTSSISSIQTNNPHYQRYLDCRFAMQVIRDGCNGIQHFPTYYLEIMIDYICKSLPLISASANANRNEGGSRPVIRNGRRTGHRDSSATVLSSWTERRRRHSTINHNHYHNRNASAIPIAYPVSQFLPPPSVSLPSAPSPPASQPASSLSQLSPSTSASRVSPAPAVLTACGEERERQRKRGRVGDRLSGGRGTAGEWFEIDIFGDLMQSTCHPATLENGLLRVIRSVGSTCLSPSSRDQLLRWVSAVETSIARYDLVRVSISENDRSDDGEGGDGGDEDGDDDGDDHGRSDCKTSDGIDGKEEGDGHNNPGSYTNEGRDEEEKQGENNERRAQRRRNLSLLLRLARVCHDIRIEITHAQDRRRKEPPVV